MLAVVREAFCRKWMNRMTRLLREDSEIIARKESTKQTLNLLVLIGLVVINLCEYVHVHVCVRVCMHALCVCICVRACVYNYCSLLQYM